MDQHLIDIWEAGYAISRLKECSRRMRLFRYQSPVWFPRRHDGTDGSSDNTGANTGRRGMNINAAAAGAKRIAPAKIAAVGGQFRYERKARGKEPTIRLELIIRMSRTEHTRSKIKDL